MPYLVIAGWVPVLFRSERFVIFRSSKRTVHSFAFFFAPHEKKGTFCSFLFFSKERKRTTGTEHSFQKIGKERLAQNVLFKRMERTDKTEHSFQKNKKERVVLFKG